MILLGSQSIIGELTLQEIQLETALMFLNPKKALEEPLYSYYNPAWILRWVVYTYGCFTLYQFPRAMYTTWCVLDLAFLVYTVKAAPAFNRPCSCLIICSEVATLAWHLCHLVLWVDVEGRAGMSQTTVRLMVILIFLACSLMVSFEVLLLVWGISGDRCQELERVRREEAAGGVGGAVGGAGGQFRELGAVALNSDRIEICETKRVVEGEDKQ